MFNQAVRLERRGDMRDTNTFAWRVMMAREEAGLKQNELVDLLKQEGIDFTYAAYSKIERGGTELPRIKVLVAISKILKVSIHKLITGVDWTEPVDQFRSTEANDVGALIDQMQPASRQAMIAAAKALLETERQLVADAEKRAEQRLFEEQRQLAYILRSYINRLETDHDRKLAREHIERIERIERNG